MESYTVTSLYRLQNLYKRDACTVLMHENSFIIIAMQEANLIYNYVKSETSVNKILLCDDNQRLDQLVYVFSKYQMIGKRYEAKAWQCLFSTYCC